MDSRSLNVLRNSFQLSLLLLIVSPILLSFPLAAAASVLFTPTDNPPIQDPGYGGSSATFSNVNIGTPSSDRVVVVGVASNDPDSCCGAPITAVTIGGSSATEAAYSDAPTVNGDATLWYATVPSGTTANIVVTGAAQDTGILVGTITGESSAAPTATSSHSTSIIASDPQLIPSTGTMTVPANGVTVLFGLDQYYTSDTPAWTNTTSAGGDYFLATSSTEGYGMDDFLAHSTATGAQSWGISGYPYGGFAGVAAAWSPAPGALSLDGHTNNNGTGSSMTLTLTTTQANDIVVFHEFNESGSASIDTVSNVTDTAGLHWVERSATTSPAMQQDGGASVGVDNEVWWALAPSALSGDTITVNLSGSTDCASVVGFGVNGANTTSPWDSNVSLPAIAISPGTGATPSTPSVSGISTTNANTMILGFMGSGAYGSDDNGAAYTPGSGYTGIDQNLQGDCGLVASAADEYEIVSSAQSNISAALGGNIGSGEGWFMVGDAIQAAGSGGGGGTGRIIRLIGGLRLIGGIRFP